MSEKMYDVNRVLSTPGPFAEECFAPGKETIEFVAHQARILVIGAVGRDDDALERRPDRVHVLVLPGRRGGLRAVADVPRDGQLDGERADPDGAGHLSP